jgi:GNAT superfamily N-acetyltransferase
VPDEPTIRLAAPEDAEAIGTLHARSWKTAYRGILPDEVLDAISVDDWIERRRKTLRERASRETFDWVIEHEGAVRGWAAGGRARDGDLGEDAFELMAIYLRPEDVGRGYGRRLMEHCVRHAVEGGHAQMTMWVLAGNERAQRFYRRAGFEPDPRVAPEVFGSTGRLKLRMWRPLP